MIREDGCARISAICTEHLFYDGGDADAGRACDALARELGDVVRDLTPGERELAGLNAALRSKKLEPIV